jgi:peptidoglycan hydrolase-like protein with peptidoglycan-binding domain
MRERPRTKIRGWSCQVRDHMPCRSATDASDLSEEQIMRLQKLAATIVVTAGTATVSLIFWSSTLALGGADGNIPEPQQGGDSVPKSASLKSGDVGQDVDRLQKYLQQFGYMRAPKGEENRFAPYANPRVLSDPPKVPGTFDEETRRALKRFQLQNRLPVTGQLNRATLDLIQSARCGVPDTAEFVTDGKKWSQTEVTYSFQVRKDTKRISAALDNDEVKEAVRQAFQLWSVVTPLTFVMRPDNDEDANIRIMFGKGNHGDGIRESFDGPRGVLAHAYSPPPPSLDGLAGDVHFDDEERWLTDPVAGIDLVTVAAHEIWHALGLGHSQVKDGLMYPYYGDPRAYLDGDDIRGIQFLYGPRRIAQAKAK